MKLKLNYNLVKPALDSIIENLVYMIINLKMKTNLHMSYNLPSRKDTLLSICFIPSMRLLLFVLKMPLKQ